LAGGWFVLREKYCWLVADKPSEQGARTEWTQQQSVKIESWTNQEDHAQRRIKDRIRLILKKTGSGETKIG
jgi:hypothetical protein